MSIDQNHRSAEDSPGDAVTRERLFEVLYGSHSQPDHVEASHAWVVELLDSMGYDATGSSGKTS